MNFNSSDLFESKLYPGVKVRIREITRGARIALDRELAALKAKEREIEEAAIDIDRQLQPFRDEAKARECSCNHEALDHDYQSGACSIQGCKCRHPEFPSELTLKANEIWIERVKFEDLYMDPALIQATVLGVEGLEIDSKPATIEALIESGPDGLTSELSRVIRKKLGLSGEEIKNSVRPTTSQEKVDGPMKTSTAQPVSEGNSTEKETAFAISPV